MTSSRNEWLAVRLPWPPSVNTYWRNFRGKTVLSAKGREYREDVEASLPSEHPVFAFPVEMRIDLYPPSRREFDVDNYMKAILDALEHCGVLENDSLVQSITASKYKFDELRKEGGANVLIHAVGFCDEY